MATINSFYRFQPAFHNSGFYPDCNNKSAMLKQMDDDFAISFVPLGMEFGAAILQLKEGVNNFNDEAHRADFVIEITDRIQYTPTNFDIYFKVSNKELLAKDPSQRIEINWNVDNGIVAVASLVYSGSPLNVVSSLSEEITPYELQAYQPILNYVANEKGRLPKGIDVLGNVSSSSIARVKPLTCTPADVAPYRQNEEAAQPCVRHSFKALGANENSCVAQLLLLVQKAKETQDEAELEAYWNTLPIPSSYTKFFLSLPYHAEFTLQPLPDTFGYTFKIVWKKGTNSVQRFYSPNPIIGQVIQTFDGETIFPFPYNTFGFVYQSATIDTEIWYDFDECVFEESCIEPVEFYSMPIKTGDTLRFNIIPELSNLLGIDACDIGLFKESGEFVAKIGTAEIPTGALTYTFELPLEFEPSCIVSSISLFENEILFANKVAGYSQNFGGSSLNVLEFLEVFVSNLTIGTAYYQILQDGYKLVWQINDTSFAFVPLASLGYEFNAGGFGTVWANCYQGELCLQSPNQLEATVSIPPAETGCYRFGLYNGYDLYSMSNLLRHDDSDCYSTLIEFSGTTSSVFSGFEYFGSWTQVVRLGINGGGEKPNFDENVYRQSNGFFKRPAVKQNYRIDLHTDFIDTSTQYALSDATRHPVFVWNGKNLFCDGDVDVATIQDFSTQSSFEPLAQVKFSALVQGYQPNQSKCLTC